MSPSTLFAFFLLAVVSMIHPATSDAYSDVLREYAITEPVRQHLEYKWLLKNFTLLPHRHGLCIRSPNFHTKDPHAAWILRFCLQEGSRKATISAALHLRPGASGSSVLRDVDGRLNIFRSGQHKAFQVFDGAAVSVDSGLQIYEYLEDEVDLLSNAGPWDDVEIIAEIGMPTQIVTEMVESPYLMGVLDGLSNGIRTPILNGPPLGPIDGPIGGRPLNGPVVPVGPINSPLGPIGGPGLHSPVGPLGPINSPLSPIGGPGSYGSVSPLGPVYGPLSPIGGPVLYGPVGPQGPIYGPVSPIGGPGLYGPVGPVGPIYGPVSPIGGPGLYGPVSSLGPIYHPLSPIGGPYLNGPVGPSGLIGLVGPPKPIGPVGPLG